MAPPPRQSIPYIQQRAAYYGLDPAAVLAVGHMEGLGGGIGDNGTSFGPWQLHYGGAYPSSAPHGSAASQAWAWSPAGIDYALRQMSGVAKGLKGRAAIANLVSRFERPANPGAEIAGASSYYGLPVSGQSMTDAQGGYGFSAVTPAAIQPRTQWQSNPFQGILDAIQQPAGPARTAALARMFTVKSNAYA